MRIFKCIFYSKFILYGKTLSYNWGIASKVVYGGTSESDACQVGYNGSSNWSSLYYGVCSITNNCIPITCSIPTTSNVTAASVNYTTSSAPLTCNAGYIGSPAYTCSGTTNPGTYVETGNSCFYPNWNAWTTIGCGSYITQSSNLMLEIQGPNGWGGQWTYFFTYLHSWATKVSFDWYYCTPDWNASYDLGRFYVNNTWYDIITSAYGYGSCYSGTFTNFAGTAFGPGIYSTDGNYVGGTLKLYNIVVQ